MRKFFLLPLLMVGFFFFLPTQAFADNSMGDTIRHAYKPVAVVGSNAVRARVNNTVMSPTKNLVCVEAFNSANVKTHLGCLWVELASYQSSGMWGFEFDAPTNMLKPGVYTVVYTYKASDGNWYRIKSMDLKVMDGMVTVS